MWWEYISCAISILAGVVTTAVFWTKMRFASLYLASTTIAANEAKSSDGSPIEDGEINGKAEF